MSEENKPAEQPATQAPKLSALERLEAVENTSKQLAATMGEVIKVLQQMDQKLQKVDNVANVVTPLSKGVAAMLNILETKGTVTSAEISNQILVNDAKVKLDQEEAGLKAGQLSVSEQSGRNSILAVKLTNDKGEDIALRDHLPLATVDENQILEFIGVKDGAVIEKNSVKYEVLRILDYVEQGIKSAEEPAAEAAPAPETTETATQQG